MSSDLDDLFGAPPAETDETAAPSRVLETVLLRFLARIIHADGEVDPKEVTTLIGIAGELEVPGSEAQRILDDEFSRQSDVAQLAQQIPDEDDRIEAYAMGCLMGCADGHMDETEIAVLSKFGNAAGIPEAEQKQIYEQVLAAAQQAKAERDDLEEQLS